MADSSYKSRREEPFELDAHSDVLSTPIELSSMRGSGPVPAIEHEEPIELSGAELVEDEAEERRPVEAEARWSDLMKTFAIDGESIEADMQIDPAPAVEPLPMGALPPERVRFTTPAEVRIEDDETTHHGAILNLSSTGAACTLSAEMTPGQRAWIRFRLGLADEAMSLLCVVVWRRESQPNHPFYGLQFIRPTAEEAARITRAVAERAEGRAGEWPLPVIPTTTTASSPSRRRGPSSWVSAGLGMVAGAALSLVLSAVPNFDVGAKPREPIAENREPVTENREPINDHRGPITEDREPKAEVAPVVAQEPALAPLPQPEPAPVAAEPTTAGPARQVLSKEPKLVGSDEAVQLTLPLDATPGEPRSFWLESPRRFVIDVAERRSTLPHKTYEVGQAMLTRVRVGQHPDKVRFVLEVGHGVKDAKVTPGARELVVALDRH